MPGPITEYSGTVPALNQTQPEFDQNTQAFIDYIADLAPEINNVATAMNLNATSGTSSTSNSIGTGAKSFTANTGKSWLPGMFIMIADTAAPSTNSMLAQITSYDSGTGALVVDVKATLGSGTKTAWTISQTANPVPLDNSVSPNSLAAALRKQLASIQDFRLTLSSGVPVTTSDVTGATTIYCCPYKGNAIALYDGTNWNLRTSAEFSLALGTLNSARPYDVFCYDNAGVPTLEFTSWTNATTRATALTYQDGVLVKSGATTRRYLGTFYTTSTTQTEDSAAKRFLWNYYNRVDRQLLRRETSASWTYTTATVRQANNNTANQVDMVIGVSEDAVAVNLLAFVNNASNTNMLTGLGLDGTTINIGQGGAGFNNAGGISQLCSQYYGLPGVGRHYITWLESSTATGTTTWYGNNTALGGTYYAGLSGSIKG